MGNKRNQRSGARKVKATGRPRKMKKLREEDTTTSSTDESFIQGTRSRKRNPTNSFRPLTRYAKKLAGLDLVEGIFLTHPETSFPDVVEVNPSTPLSTTRPVQQILTGGLNTPKAAAEIPASNISRDEEPSLNDHRKQIFKETYGTASIASTEVVASDPTVLDHAHQEAHSSLKLPSQLEISSSPNDIQTPPVFLKEQKLSVSVDHGLDANDTILGLLQDQDSPKPDPTQRNDPFVQAQEAGLTSLASPTISVNHYIEKKDNSAGHSKSKVSAPHANSTCTTRCTSLNMTKLIHLMDDESSDEVESGQNTNPWIEVKGYKLKKEVGSLVEAILHKYGDIAEKSPFSIKTRSIYLEMVCGIYKDLEASKFKELGDEEIQSMLKQVEDLEALVLEVGWLRSRLVEISKAKHLCNGVSVLKEERTKNYQVVEEKKAAAKESKDRLLMCHKGLSQCQKELESWVAKFHKLKEEYDQKKDELAEAEAEKNEINEKFLDTKDKFRQFYDKSLVDGLI